jgi:hypothetical protein
MRRFIEEIRVQDPMIANTIIAALEAKPEKQEGEKHTMWKSEPRNNYEVDVFEVVDRDPIDKGPIPYPVKVLKIFVREDAK